MQDLFKVVLEKAFLLKNKKVSTPFAPKELKEKFDFKLNKDKISLKKLENIVEEIFNLSVNTQSPKFLNQLYGGTQDVTWLGEFLNSILNTSMATYEIAPLFTLMEKELIHSINQRIGFKNCDGLMVPGGSYANMMGIHAARYSKDPLVKEQGVCASKKYKIFVSDCAHYSTGKSLGLLGLGLNALVKVKADDNRKMCVVDLKEKIKKCLDHDELPLCIVSTAGTTVWGSFDPIFEINKICKEYGIWHHVDAAWGGLALWSEKKEEVFKGISEVDSITMDFHKLMASSVTKAFFITAHPEVMYDANSGGGGKYIFHNEGDGENLDTGVYALQCGRKADALPLWLQWKYQGTEKFETKVVELYETLNWALELIKSQPKKFKVLQNPEFMNLCFQVLPSDQSVDVGDFNRDLRAKLMSRGNFMVNFSSCKEHGSFFRLVLNHWGVNPLVLKDFFDELEGILKN